MHIAFLFWACDFREVDYADKQEDHYFCYKKIECLFIKLLPNKSKKITESLILAK